MGLFSYWNEPSLAKYLLLELWHVSLKKLKFSLQMEKPKDCSNLPTFCFSFVAMPRIKGEELLFKSLWRQFLIIFFNSLMNLLLTYVENKAVQTITLSEQNVWREAIPCGLEWVASRKYLSSTPALKLDCKQLQISTTLKNNLLISEEMTW